MIARIRAWLSRPEFLLSLDLCRLDRGWTYLEFASLIRSDSCILAANKVSETRRASCRKGCHQNAKGLLAGFWRKSSTTMCRVLRRE